MLTKATAIARLRATGTLGSDETTIDVIPASAGKEQLAREISKVLLSNPRARGVRMVAPGANQAVLP
jgi:hypothetical protein